MGECAAPAVATQVPWPRRAKAILEKDSSLPQGEVELPPGLAPQAKQEPDSPPEDVLTEVRKADLLKLLVAFKDAIAALGPQPQLDHLVTGLVNKLGPPVPPKVTAADVTAAKRTLDAEKLKVDAKRKEISQLKASLAQAETDLSVLDARFIQAKKVHLELFNKAHADDASLVEGAPQQAPTEALDALKRSIIADGPDSLVPQPQERYAAYLASCASSGGQAQAYDEWYRR